MYACVFKNHFTRFVAGRGPGSRAGPVWEAALRVGAGAVLSLPGDESRLAGLLTESAHGRAGRSPVVSVLGGRGGAGASLLALALIMGVQRAGLNGALVDADPMGSGLDALLGHEEAAGDRWGDLVARQGRLNWSALRARLPSVRGAAVVTWARGPAAAVPPTAMRAVLGCASRGSDVVVADVPRAPDPAADEALRRTTVALLVVPAELPAVFAAARLVPRLRRTVRDVRLVVRETGTAVSAPDVARTLDLPLSAHLHTDRALLRSTRQGTMPAFARSSPLTHCADRLVSALVADAAEPAAPP